MFGPVAVLGGGHGGHCMAADLTLRGHDVHLYEHPRFQDSFRTTLERGCIQLGGPAATVTGEAKLRKVTTDMSEAVRGTRFIHVVVPAFAHDPFFRELLPRLEDGQTVVVWSGDFGSLRLAWLLRQEYPAKEILVAETSTIPYGTRRRAGAEVDLLLVAPRVTVAALPAKATGELLPTLKAVWPCLEPADNVLAAALSNPNPICHPPGSLLNVGRIQHSGGQFFMYREGITEAVARVIQVLYQETRALAAALACEVIEYEEEDFWTSASIMGAAFQAPAVNGADTLGIIAGVLGPTSISHRYITEDLPYGLVPMSQLGDKLGVDTPVIDSMVHLGSAVCGSDFWATGRTLDTLGIDTLDGQALLRYVTEGVR
ncbi:MAG TPA: NAD/NADP octopine/nopaline dehydrogenase family protein [Bacillota bacterium]|nr:NAD/NADP octopine/nopaline dehydrogenase family protein [Bacillota bacterium]